MSSSRMTSSSATGSRSSPAYSLDGVRLGSDTFVGPNATFTNDRFPRSKAYPENFLETFVDDGASIGANATILPGIRIGRSAMVGAGAVVTKDVPAYAVIVGNPAVIVGYQTPKAGKASAAVIELARQTGLKGRYRRCRLLALAASAIFGFAAICPRSNFIGIFPSVPARSFLVHGVPTAKIRGEHAHFVCKQFLIAAHGRLSVMVDDGKARSEVELSDPGLGILSAAAGLGGAIQVSARHRVARLCVASLFQQRLYKGLRPVPSNCRRQMTAPIGIHKDASRYLIAGLINTLGMSVVYFVRFRLPRPPFPDAISLAARADIRCQILSRRVFARLVAQAGRTGCCLQS